MGKCYSSTTILITIICCRYMLLVVLGYFVCVTVPKILYVKFLIENVSMLCRKNHCGLKVLMFTCFIAKVTFWISYKLRSVLYSVVWCFSFNNENNKTVFSKRTLTEHTVKFSLNILNIWPSLHYLCTALYYGM